MDEVDFNEVIKLVESALADEGPDALKPEQSIPLGFMQGDILERLYSKIDTYLDHATKQVVFDELRSELYSGMNLPPLKDLHTMSLHCRRCKDAVEPNPNLPMWNLSDPDCVIIIDNPLRSENVVKTLLTNLAGVGFSSKRVGLTYVNRCPAKTKLEPQHIKNCASFLHTEIEILKPKLIVPMGSVATAAVLGVDIKLADYRGEVHWLGPWAILPTYSPAFVANENVGESVVSNFKNDLTTAYHFCYG